MSRALGEMQEDFMFCLHLLLQNMYDKGYRVRGGDLKATEGHINNSTHYVSLAIDLNLFKDGVYLTETVDHKEFGEFWESIDVDARWGGRFDDGNHYSFKYRGVS